MSKNGRPADLQVTSAEILADAHDIKQTGFRKPSSTIQDLDELRSFQLAKRRDYEQQLNKNRLNYGQWMRYAKWEIEFNHDFKRARSIMERALEVNVQHVPFWVRYIEFELLHKNVNHARNLLDRAVTTMPRTDKFWLMYAQTEETLGNFTGVRSVFERWLKWHPNASAWDSYASFEERYGEVENARAVFVRYVVEFPNGDTWKRWLDFETKLPTPGDTQMARTRGVFEAAIDTLLESETSHADPAIGSIVSLWIRWELLVNEKERAQAILTTVMDHNYLSKEQKLKVLSDSTQVQEAARQTGLQESSEKAEHLQKRLLLEKQISENPRDYDAWWEYSKLQELSLGHKAVIDLLSTAVLNAPQDDYKSVAWRRYIYLWMKLALYCEYSVNDISRARTVWSKCLQTIPHERFTFAKAWTMYSEFELRNGDGIFSTRKLLGQAIGQTCKHEPKKKILKYYIELESRLGELDRVRKLYEKWLEDSIISDKKKGASECTDVLRQYINFERSQGEPERCIALYELGIADDLPTNPGMLDEFIEFLQEEFRYEKARAILRDRLNSTNSWIQLAHFESSILSPNQMNELTNAENDEVQFEVGEFHLKNSRAIFSEAYAHFKGARDGASAKLITEAWLDYENEHGNAENIENVKSKIPKLVTKRRNTDGTEVIYHEYEFPDAAPNVSKFLARAKQWASTTEE